MNEMLLTLTNEPNQTISIGSIELHFHFNFNVCRWFCNGTMITQGFYYFTEEFLIVMKSSLLLTGHNPDSLLSFTNGDYFLYVKRFI